MVLILKKQGEDQSRIKDDSQPVLYFYFFILVRKGQCVKILTEKKHKTVEVHPL